MFNNVEKNYGDALDRDWMRGRRNSIKKNLRRTARRFRKISFRRGDDGVLNFRYPYVI